MPTGVFASDQHKPLVRYEGSEQVDDSPPNPSSGGDQPSAPSGPEVMEIEQDLVTEPDPLVDWRTFNLNYLLHDTPPTDKAEARRLARRAKSFVLVGGELYKQNHIGIL